MIYEYDRKDFSRRKVKCTEKDEKYIACTENDEKICFNHKGKEKDVRKITTCM